MKGKIWKPSVRNKPGKLQSKGSAKRRPGALPKKRQQELKLFMPLFMPLLLPLLQFMSRTLVLLPRRK